jgi:6-phosphogluconolactonase
MKFKKFGKVLLMGALSVGVVLGITSCVRSYSVGYLYVTGTVTAGSGNNGIISGFKIDHNTGQLIAINGLPVSSGGSNPIRAVLVSDSRFLYVLNRGTTASGSTDCTPDDPCQNSNITEFAVGGNGILTQQQTFYTQGINPFRLISDLTGSYLMVLDHDAPDNYDTYNASTSACTQALGTGIQKCGDVTIFQINQTNGRLSVIQNSQVSSASGLSLNYFPVPANPVDFALSGNSFLLTMSSASAATSFPYIGGSTVWPYAYNASSGQLTLGSSGIQSLGINKGTAIVYSSNVVYVLDNEAPSPNPNGASSQILPWSVTSTGFMQAETGGVVADDSTLANPIALLVESKGKFIYVANQGNETLGANAGSGIAGYFLTTSPSYQLSFISGEPFGSGSGPQCIVEDPSDQYIYEANEYDSLVTGRVVDPNSGVLDQMRVNPDVPVQGPSTWCLIDGRTG